MARAIGIDLGTTNSAIAFINDYGRPEIIPNRQNGSHLTPSVVQFDGDQVLVGADAKQSAVLHPADTVQFVKRQMGNPEWRFVDSRGEHYKAEEVSALILRQLKQDAEAKLGEPVDKAVISVPAYFDDARRRATIDAGQIAGLEVLRIINEPTAAAIAYGIDTSAGERLMVYDLGGGTFDVTAMRVKPGELEVIATGGDSNLGGFDWDNELMSIINEAFMARGGPDLFDDPVTEQDLRARTEETKKKLSQIEQAKVHLSAKGVTERITVTRAEFEDRTASLLDRTSIILDQVREEAGWTWKQVEKLLLAGGSTRMPQVTTLIRTATGHSANTELHPDEVVAAGAALQAALLLPRNESVPIMTKGGKDVPRLIVQDVTAHSLGVLALLDYGQLFNSIIIHKNSHLPASGTDLFSTVVHNQQIYECQVTEGESMDPADVKEIGTGTIRLPGTYPANSPMQVSMSYDLDGIVHVYVHDLVANRPLGELHIERESNLDPREVLELAERSMGLELE